MMPQRKLRPAPLPQVPAANERAEAERRSAMHAALLLAHALMRLDPSVSEDELPDLAAVAF